MVDLVVHKRIGRELDMYRVRSAVALAAQQLQEIGEPIRLGQRVPFVYTLGSSRVCAWHANIPLDPRMVDYMYYSELLVRAALAVLQPLDIGEQLLKEYMQNDGIVQIPLAL